MLDTGTAEACGLREFHVLLDLSPRGGLCRFSGSE
jgi:hypothetical protein